MTDRPIGREEKLYNLQCCKLAVVSQWVLRDCRDTVFAICQFPIKMRNEGIGVITLASLKKVIDTQGSILKPGIEPETPSWCPVHYPLNHHFTLINKWTVSQHSKMRSPQTKNSHISILCKNVIYLFIWYGDTFAGEYILHNGDTLASQFQHECSSQNLRRLGKESTHWHQTSVYSLVCLTCSHR